MSRKFKFQTSETESHLLYRFGTHAYQILLFNIHLNPQDTLYLSQCLIYLMIKSLALLEIVGKQFGRRQDFFILFRELAQVEVAIGGDKVFNRIATRFLVTISNNNLLTVVPPLTDWVAMFRLHGLCLGEMLVPLWHIQTIEPRFLCRITFWSALRTGIVEEQNVRGNGSVGRKDATWQTDNGMQVEISEQFGLDGYLCVVRTKQETVWNNDRCTTFLFKRYMMSTINRSAVSLLRISEGKCDLTSAFPLPPYGGFINTTSNLSPSV